MTEIRIAKPICRFPYHLKYMLYKTDEKSAFNFDTETKVLY